MKARSVTIVKIGENTDVKILFSMYSWNWRVKGGCEGGVGYKTTLSNSIGDSQWVMLLLLVLLLLTNPAMLISLSRLQQGSNMRNVANSGKQQQDQEEIDPGQASRGQLLDVLPLVVTPRRLSPLNSSGRNLPGSSAVERSMRSNSRAKPKVESELELRQKRQHAFELGLEKMLFEVEKGRAADWERKNEEKEKEVKKNKNEEKPPGWQKIWYKRLG